MSEHNLQRLETLSERTFPLLEDGTAIRSARRAVWRRVGEFCTVFALCCAVSLWYVYMRPAIYESTAMLQIIPRNSGFIGARPDTTDANDVNVQQHIAAHPSVTSRARQQVDEKLTTSDAATEPNPADLPALMSATILEGTDVLELRAEGSQAEQLSLLVDAWIDVYLASHQTAEKAAMPTANAALRKQLEELESRVKKNRESLADFRETHNIESMQREENHVLKQLKGLSEALNKAQDEQRVAAAQLKTIQEKLTRGKFVGEPEDQAVIDEMELAADQLQDIILQRRQLLTSAAFARDETAQKAKKQLTALNELIARKRALVVENAFDEAEIELATSRQISEATKKELAEYQQKAAEFTTRFAEHEALVAELNQLEKLYRALKEKLVHTEVIRDVLPPEVTVLQYASIPQDPIRPFYRRDAAIAVAGSLLCALIAILIDLLITQPLKAAGVTERQTVIYREMDARALPPAMPTEFVQQSVAAALPHVSVRELSPTEVRGMLQVSDSAAQALLGGLLSGLEVEELRKLQWADVDLETGAIRTGNTHQRTVTLSNEVRQLFQNHADHKSEPGVFVWDSSNQEPYSTAAIDALVNSAAHQAGVPAAEDIGAETLRSTYIAFLARQGVRRDLLEQTVGRLSQPMQDSIQMLSPPGANEDLQTIQRVYPALRAKAGSPGS